MKNSLSRRAATVVALASVAFSSFASASAAMQRPDLEVIAFTDALILGTNFSLLEVGGITPGVDEGWVTTAIIGIDVGVLESVIYGDPSADGSQGPSVLRRPTTLGGYVQARLGRPQLRDGQIAYLASQSTDPSDGFDSAWVDDELIAMVGDPVGSAGLTWEQFRDIKFGFEDRHFLRGRTTAGSVITREPSSVPVLAFGDTVQLFSRPVRRIESLTTHSSGAWAARVVMDVPLTFRQTIISNGAVWQEGGSPVIEDTELGVDLGLPGARWGTFPRLEFDGTGRLTFQASIELPTSEIQRVTVRRHRIVDVGGADRIYRDSVGAGLALFSDTTDLSVNGNAIGDAASRVDTDGDGVANPGGRLGFDSFGDAQWAAAFTSSGIVARCLIDLPGPDGNVIALVRPTRSNQGEEVCEGVPNSTLYPSTLTGLGETSSSANRLTLLCSDLPTGSMGYVIASRQSGFVANPHGSQGNLCLGGEIGRLIDDMFMAGQDGLATVPLDLRRIPRPIGTVATMAGETWFFQAWHRDDVGGMMTSNFSSAVSVTLTQ